MEAVKINTYRRLVLQEDQEDEEGLLTGSTFPVLPGTSPYRKAVVVVCLLPSREFSFRCWDLI